MKRFWLLSFFGLILVGCEVDSQQNASKDYPSKSKRAQISIEPQAENNDQFFKELSSEETFFHFSQLDPKDLSEYDNSKKKAIERLINSCPEAELHNLLAWRRETLVHFQDPILQRYHDILNSKSISLKLDKKVGITRVLGSIASLEANELLLRLAFTVKDSQHKGAEYEMLRQPEDYHGLHGKVMTGLLRNAGYDKRFAEPIIQIISGSHGETLANVTIDLASGSSNQAVFFHLLTMLDTNSVDNVELSEAMVKEMSRIAEIQRYYRQKYSIDKGRPDIFPENGSDWELVLPTTPDLVEELELKGIKVTKTLSR